ncbi:MAG: PEP-CTERM sorting domain-containing protein [Rubrivivax sp.]|nr:PEP-CTERM sorting domain-containing protein [Rubrivivax sp.]
MTDLSAYTFSNLHFSMRSGADLASSSGDGIGFEVTSDRAFKPGGVGYFNDAGGATGGLIQWATTPGTASQFGVIELAIDRSVFQSNALGVTGYTGAMGPTFLGLRLNLSQTFGYAVVGGTSYGDTRLGLTPLAAVPEASTWALMALGLGLVGFVARRRAV